MNFTPLNNLMCHVELSPRVQEECKQLNDRIIKIKSTRQQLRDDIASGAIDDLPRDFRGLLNEELELRNAVHVWLLKAKDDLRKAQAHQEACVREIVDLRIEELESLGYVQVAAMAKSHPSVVVAMKETESLKDSLRAYRNFETQNNSHLLDVNNQIRGLAKQVIDGLQIAQQYRPVPPSRGMETNAGLVSVGGEFVGDGAIRCP